MDTHQLLIDAQAGSRSAFDQLLLRHRGRLTAFVASRMSRSLRAVVDPDDIVQETWLQASSKLDSFVVRRSQGFYHWLVKIADFKLKEADRRRRAKKRGNPASLEIEPPAQQTSIVSQIGRGERALWIAEELETLPEGQAEAVRLRYLEALSVAATAERMGRSESAVKALVARGLQQLAGRIRP